MLIFKVCLKTILLGAGNFTVEVLMLLYCGIFLIFLIQIVKFIFQVNAAIVVTKPSRYLGMQYMTWHSNVNSHVWCTKLHYTIIISDELV